MNNNIKDKTTLINELKTKKKEISGSTYNYLLKLINLEVSALEENLNSKELKEVISLDIFTDIVTYNIYALAYEYSRTHADIEVDDQINNVKLKTNSNRVFEFFYDDGFDHTPNREVNLFKTIYDPEYNEMLDEMLTKQLEDEYKKENPFGNKHTSYRGPENDWLYQHQQKIDKLNKQLKDLRDHDIPNEKEKEELETLEIFNESLLDYFKVDRSNFVEKESYGDNKRKTLTKKVNNVKVYNNIRYI